MSGPESVGAGQVALVTGAARGIGRRIAITLARYGYRTGLVDSLSDELAVTAEHIARMGGEVVTVTGDVTSPENVEHCCDTVEKCFDPVDVVVDNAGCGGQFGRFAETDPDAPVPAEAPGPLRGRGLGRLDGGAILMTHHVEHGWPCAVSGKAPPP